MASPPSIILLKRGVGQLLRSYHTSPSAFAGQIWRKSRGLPANPNAYGALVDGPDYSFVDGRPTPPGYGKIRRAEKQLELSTKIMQYAKEVDFAVDFHKERVAKEEERRAAIINRKLKPKGKTLE